MTPEGQTALNLTAYIAMVLAGAALALLFSLNEAKAKKAFKWSKFFKDNWVPVLINVIAGIAIVFAEYDNPAPVYQITKLSCMVLGVSGQFIFKKICNIFGEKQTAFGLNVDNINRKDED